MRYLIQEKLISIVFDSFCLIVLLAKLTTVVLLTCMGVGGWECLISSSVLQMGKASLALRKVAPI